MCVSVCVFVYESEFSCVCENRFTCFFSSSFSFHITHTHTQLFCLDNVCACVCVCMCAWVCVCVCECVCVCICACAHLFTSLLLCNTHTHIHLLHSWLRSPAYSTSYTRFSRSYNAGGEGERERDSAGQSDYVTRKDLLNRCGCASASEWLHRSNSMCVRVCARTYARLNVCVCVCKRVHIHVHACVCVFVCTYMYTYKCICPCMCACIYTGILHVLMIHVCACTSIYLCIGMIPEAIPEFVWCIIVSFLVLVHDHVYIYIYTCICIHILGILVDALNKAQIQASLRFYRWMINTPYPLFFLYSCSSVWYWSQPCHSPQGPVNSKTSS